MDEANVLLVISKLGVSYKYKKECLLTINECKTILDLILESSKAIKSAADILKGEL